MNIFRWKFLADDVFDDFSFLAVNHSDGNAFPSFVRQEVFCCHLSYFFVVVPVGIPFSSNPVSAVADGGEDGLFVSRQLAGDVKVFFEFGFVDNAGPGIPDVIGLHDGE